MSRLEPDQTSLERPENSCTPTLPIQPELERICREECKKFPKYRCAKLAASYPRRLEAKIAAKGASTEYCINSLNIYVNVFFLYLYILICKNFKKPVFALWDIVWGIVCRIEELHFFIHFRIRLLRNKMWTT